MAKTSGVRICGRCSVVLPSPTPPICPSCGSHVAGIKGVAADKTRFKPVVSIWGQYNAEKERIQKECSPDSDEYKSGMATLESEARTVIREMSYTDKINTLCDVTNFMRIILQTPGTAAEVKKICASAKKIGEIADAALKFMEIARSSPPEAVESERDYADKHTQ